MNKKIFLFFVLSLINNVVIGTGTWVMLSVPRCLSPRLPHGIRSNSTNAVYQIPFSQNLRQRKNLFNGYTKLSKILKRR